MGTVTEFELRDTSYGVCEESSDRDRYEVRATGFVRRARIGPATRFELRG